MSPELIGILSVGAALLVGMGGMASLNVALYRGLRADMRSDMGSLRSEFKAESAVLREDVKTEIAAVRQDVKADSAALRQDVKADIAALREDVMADSAALREDVKADIAAVRQDVKSVETRVVALEVRVAAVEQGQARLTGEIQGLFVGLGNARAVREREPAA